jgi:hypothetical protein
VDAGEIGVCEWMQGEEFLVRHGNTVLAHAQPATITL